MSVEGSNFFCKEFEQQLSMAKFIYASIQNFKIGEFAS